MYIGYLPITMLPGCAKKAVIPQQLADLSLVKMWDGVIKNIECSQTRKISDLYGCMPTRQGK